MTEVSAVLRLVGDQWMIALPTGVPEAAGWLDGQTLTVLDLADDPVLEQIAAEAAAATASVAAAVDRTLGAGQELPPVPASVAISPETEELAARAKDQLALVLSFFARVETKLSVVLAVDLAMISIAFAKVLPLADVSFSVLALLAVFAVMQVASLILLYRGSFPHLADGERSLIYFRSIAQFGEAEYRTRFSERELAAHVGDLLEQAWINARILTVKFDRLKRAYFWMGLSVAPWVVALAVLALAAAR
ncbi:Pycsar system effector family protein [Luteibacter sp. CQ10]|uniref:Pycsar system effector family protein n=1 Tax=Luteibacter sp. CQ10 TaxID=2805821 RepID=UPI0034A23EA5